MNPSIVINTQQEQKRSVQNLLQFFQDDRGKNILRSFAALSQNYVDLRACCIHGVVKNVQQKQIITNNNKDNAQSDDKQQQEEENSYSLIHDPTNEKFQSVQTRVKSIRDSIDTIKSASTSLLNELLKLMNKVKETSHATFIGAFNFVDAKKRTSSSSSPDSSLVVDVNLRLLKDVLENLVNSQLQNKIVTIHVIFNEVLSAVKHGLGTDNHDNDDDNEISLPSPKEVKWKLTLDQLRIYQAALTAEFSALASSGAGVGSGTHPLESIPSMLDRVGILCGKIVQ